MAMAAGSCCNGLHPFVSIHPEQEMTFLFLRPLGDLMYLPAHAPLDEIAVYSKPKSPRTDLRRVLALLHVFNFIKNSCTLCRQAHLPRRSATREIAGVLDF